MLAPRGISIHSRSECRFRHAQFTQLRPDRNSGIGSEDIWREADIGKLPRNIAHGLKGDGAVGFGLTGIAEDQIERDADAGEIRLARGFVHLVDALVALVHQLQHRL